MDTCPDLAEITNADYLRWLYGKARAAQVPLSASIELTERCNLHCVHCYLGEQDLLRERRGAELDADRWREILDQIAELACLRLLITGGDPLLRPDFAAIYRHAKECGLLVTVFTNGTLITPAIVELFRELPPAAVEITLYGATAATYERITGVPGSYARCLTGIERLRALGVELGLKTILMKPNRHEFAAIAELCRTLGTKKFRFDAEIQGEFGGSGGPLRVRLDPEEAVRMEFSDPDRAADWRDYWQRRKDQTPAHPERLYNCGAADGGFHVGPYGQIQPCLTTRHIAFDLATGTLRQGLAAIREQIWSRRAPEARMCHTCGYRMVCNSCPAFSRLEQGMEEQPAEFQCRATRARVAWIEGGAYG